MKTFMEAQTEYFNLRNDDPDFEDQWNETEEDFFEWCSLYDDLKHITNKEAK